MLRLFGTVGLLVVVSAGLALGTGSLLFRLLTPIAALSLLGIYLWLQRSLPPRRGTLRLKGLRETVEVFRDEHGVPHIYARNLHDLYLAQGYVTAQDRLWAMDLHRRTASGRLAELFGEEALESDKHFRRMGLSRSAEQSLEAYSPAVRTYLQAYADGVNARISEDRLPPEFGLLWYRPDAWTPADSVLVAKLLAHDLTGSWAGNLFRGCLVQTVGAEKAAELFPNPPNPEALAELEDTALPERSRLSTIAASTVNEAVGSTAWAVSGNRSRSGAPMLAADLHATVRTPSLWYQSHLTGPDGLDVVGVALPGAPGILVGQNREIAWGVTTIRTSVQDLVVEQFHPTQLREYAAGGAWVKADVRSEHIRVRGDAEPHVLEVAVSRHGPIIAEDGATGLALQWAGLGPTKELETFLLINSASNWPEFRQALESYDGPPLEFLCAGRNGVLGRRVAGTLPVRTAGDRQAPCLGWVEENTWVGRLSFEELPETTDPSDGVLIGGESTAPTDRVKRLRERVGGAADISSTRVLEIQTEKINLHARSMLQPLLHAVQEGLRQGPQPETLSDTERRALLLLSGWDCSEELDSPAPALWHQWYQFFMEGIFRPQMGLDLFDLFVACGSASAVTDRLVRQVVEGGSSAWLGREGEEGLSRIALRSFRRSVALVSAKQGRQPEQWRWGREHRIRFSHPLGARSRFLRWVLNLGPTGIGGSGHTLWPAAYHPLQPFDVGVYAPWRQVVDFGSAEGTQEICAPGQSGHGMSAHYSDQLATWLRGGAFVRPVRHESIRTLPRLLLVPEN